MGTDRGSNFAQPERVLTYLVVVFSRKDCISMNSSNSTTGKTEKLKDTKALAFQWETMNWCKIENDVNRLQSRIAKATENGKKK
jgi:hypothetical protein